MPEPDLHDDEVAVLKRRVTVLEKRVDDHARLLGRILDREADR